MATHKSNCWGKFTRTRCKPGAHSTLGDWSKQGGHGEPRTTIIQLVGNIHPFSYFSIFSILCYLSNTPHYKYRPFLFHLCRNGHGRFLLVLPYDAIYLDASTDPYTFHCSPIRSRLSFCKCGHYWHPSCYCYIEHNPIHPTTGIRHEPTISAIAEEFSCSFTN